MNLIDEAYACRACTDLGFQGLTPDGPFFKFPPTIGATGPAPLLFVGINPRLSGSNRALHENIMDDASAFLALSMNRVGSRRYIGVPGLEKHYEAHLEITERVFPGKQFEDSAAVTELYLCAKETATGLPITESPCATRFLGKTLQQIQPRVVIPVGKLVLGYFQNRQQTFEASFEGKFDGIKCWIVPMSHPNARSKDKVWPIEWTAERIKSILKLTPAVE